MAEREQVPFRLRADDYRRLKKVARRIGGSVQSFIEGAVMHEISEMEARHQHRKEDVAEERTERASRFAPFSSTNGHVGLGISEHLRAIAGATPAMADESLDTHAQAPVVVNVGTTTSSSGANNDIDRLATFVAGGKDFERSMRL